MRITPAVASVVGKSSPSLWAQVYITPECYAVVEVTHPQDPRTVGVSVLHNLREALDPLPLTPQKINQVIASVWNEWIQTLIVLVPVGTTMCLAMKGEGEVYIHRGVHVAKLLSGTGAIAGEAQESDTLFLATASIVQSISPEHISQLFDHLSATQAAEKLTMYLNQDAASYGGAAMVYQVSRLTDDMVLEVSNQQEEKEPWFGFVAGKLRQLTPTWKRPVISHVVLHAKIREWKKHPRKLLIPICIAVVAVVFGISVVLGLLRAKPPVADTNVVAIQALLDEGISLLELNPLKARQQLNDAKIQLTPLLVGVNEKTQNGKTLIELSQKIESALITALRIYTVKPEVFYDVSLVKEKSTASAIALAQDVVGIVDRQLTTAYSLTVSGKKATILGGASVVSGTSWVSVQADQVYTLTDNGVFQLSANQKVVPQNPVIKKDQKWGIIGSLVAYAGNVYLLDAGTSRIWKYVAVEEGFSEIREYLNPDTLVDLSKATSMAIDGSVWVATQDGKLLRFTQGRENPLVLRDIEPDLGSPLSVFTDDESKFVYLLDSTQKRVVVIDKEGKYVAQYVWQIELQPTALVVSESLKRVILLAGGVLYSFGLQ